MENDGQFFLKKKIYLYFHSFASAFLLTCVMNVALQKLNLFKGLNFN